MTYLDVLGPRFQSEKFVFIVALLTSSFIVLRFIASFLFNRPILKEYTKELKLLGEKLLRILSETLGLAPDTLRLLLSPALLVRPCSLLSSNFYGLNDRGEALATLCHDPSFLTFLLADESPEKG